MMRRFWISVSRRLSSSSVSGICGVSSSLGEFDCLPIDVVMQILKLITPKDAARMSLACKAWKVLISDNRLWIFYLQSSQEPWDSIFFGETYLRSGLRSRLYLNPVADMSFMRIYGERAKVPGAIIIDGGSGYCKYGWSKYRSPSGQSATFLEFGNIETPMISRLKLFFVTIFSRMQVKPSSQPVIVSIPLCHYDDTEAAKASRRRLKDAMKNVLFDMDVPAVCAINQAILALIAARRTSGLVVNIGFQVTLVVPILHGKVMRKIGVEAIGLGAMKLTGYLKELLQQNNVNFQSLYTVRTLKEKLCYVAADYKDELAKDTAASTYIPGEGLFTLSKERFQTPEILFQPRLGGIRAMSLHQAVSLCMEHCQAAELTGDDNWFKTIILAGGTACLPGLRERLEKELHDLDPSISNGVRIIPPPHGAETAWYGAKLISNLSTFTSQWCTTKKQFRRSGRLKLR